MSKVSVQKVLLCPFHCKPRPLRVRLDSPTLDNITQVPGNRAEVCQNQDARNTVSATLLVLKRGLYFFPEARKSAFKQFCCVHFTANQGHQELVYVRETGKYFSICGKSSRRGSKSQFAQGGLGYSFSRKVKWGYISAQKLKSKRSKSFPVSISLQSKIISH